jgi:2-polyprenyl-6-methoxyphenol hydroxylase-like FAD-dependent oxidoreductase
MARTLKIAIVGYGIAGIAAAIHLRRLGHQIEHFERNSSTASSGAGMLLHPPALSFLEDLGLLTTIVACGVPIGQLFGQPQCGRKIMDIRYADRDAGEFGLGIQRGALLEILRAADSAYLDLRHGHHMTSVDANHGYLFEDGGRRHGPYDIVVAADGANSPLRRCISRLVRRDKLYPSAALTCLVDDPNALAGARVAQYFDGVHHVAVWPVGAVSPGEAHRTNISIKVVLATASEFRSSGAWSGAVARLCPQIAPLLQPGLGFELMPLIYSYRDVVLRRYYCGRVVFIGDAAHSMSPQLGQGARLALEDAAVLSRAIGESENFADALREYDLKRRASIARLQRASRWLTPLFQSNSRLLAALRDHASYRISRRSLVASRIQSLLCGS